LVRKILGGVIIGITANVNGTLKALTEISVNSGGALKSLSTVHTNVSGALKQIFSAKPEEISGSCSGSTTGVTVASNIVVPSSCTVNGSLTLSPKGSMGPAVMYAVDGNNKTTYIFNKSQSNSTGTVFTGSTTLPVGTYSFVIVAYNFSSSGVGSSPSVKYSITFS
jgi:hypothetical protein